MSNEQPKRGSRVTIPQHANPLAKIVFAEMRRQGITYDEMEWRSGVLRSTLKSYRNEKTPSLQSIEALLGAVGWGLAPFPKLETLPPEVQAKVEEIGEHFISDESVLAAAIAAVAQPRVRAKDGQPAARLERRTPYWLAEAA